MGRRVERRRILLHLTAGAAVGMAWISVGMLRERGWRPSFAQVLQSLAIAAFGGAAIAFGLELTQGLRRKGLWGHYTAWILSTTPGVVIIMCGLNYPLGYEPGSVTFGLLMGPLAGLGLGAYARWLKAETLE